MKILILSQYYPPEIGAPQTRLSAIARVLKEMGEDVQVLTGMPNYPEGQIQVGYRHKLLMQEKVEDIPVRRVWLYPAKGAGVGRLINYLSFVISAAAGALFVRKPDLVLVESPPLTLMLTARLLCSAWRAQCVMYVADLWPDSAVDAGLLAPGPLLAAVRKLEKWAYAHADFVVASARGSLTSLADDKKIPRAKLLFLPNAAEVQETVSDSDQVRIRRELQLPESDCLLLYAGTIGFFHGLEVAVRAMKLLEKSTPELRLLVVGDGSSLKEVMSEATAIKAGRVEFRRPVSLQELSKYWAVADIGLVCQKDLSIAEKMRPAKMLAIMAAGKPVMFSGRGEGADLIEEADGGIVVPPADSVALAGALKRLSSDAGLRLRLGNQGRTYVRANLTWEEVIRTWWTELRRANPFHNGVA